ncbi:MAG: NAD(P)/FAD-dependent oxidoreductase [Acidimicrobiia bacterium]
MEHADFVIIGGGIAGASAGFELAERGRVVLLEREQTAGYHTTGRSAALYTEIYERGPIRALTLAGREFFEDPPPGFAEHPLLSPLPVLFIGREDQGAALDALRNASGGSFELEVVTGDALRELCPVLRPDRIVSGLLEVRAKEIDVHGLHQGFLAGIRRRGGVVRTDAGVTKLQRDDATWIVVAGGVTVEAPVVVNAAGAWCEDVAGLAGAAPVGLTPLRRTAFTFGPEDHDLEGWPMVVDAHEDFYFKPERVQLMGSLAEETPMTPHDVRHDEIDVALAIERIKAATTFDIRHVRRAWAGLRTFTTDRLPVVGFDPEVQGFFWLAGQGGFGIMTSPALGRVAAALVCDGELPTDLVAAGVAASEISPVRFQPNPVAGET